MELQVRLIIANSIEDADLPEQLVTPSANTFHFLSDNLSIDDARKITLRLGSKPFGSDQQTIIVQAYKIAREAQNALLKSFEEPYTNTTLLLIIPDETLLLPTLRSRFTAVERPLGADNSEVATEFLRLSYSERLNLVTEKVKAKDYTWMSNLIQTLPGSLEKSNLVANKALELTALNIRNRGASAKMLLENLALSLPINH